MADQVTTVPEHALRLVESRRDVLRTSLEQAGIDWQRFSNSVMTSIADADATLRDAIAANPDSFLSAVSRAASYGLVLGPPHQHCFLIPYREHGHLVVQFQIGYKGLCELAYRHPRVSKLEARLVYKGEEVEYDQAADCVTRHPYDPTIDRSDANVVWGYATATLNDGQKITRALNRAQIEARRKRGKGKQPAWTTDYQPMCIKTLHRALLSSGTVPLSSALAAALDDEQREEVEELRQAEVEVKDEPKPPSSRLAAIAQKLGVDAEEQPAQPAPTGGPWVSANVTSLRERIHEAAERLDAVNTQELVVAVATRVLGRKPSRETTTPPEYARILQALLDAIELRSEIALTCPRRDPDMMLQEYCQRMFGKHYVPAGLTAEEHEAFVKSLREEREEWPI